MATIAIDPRVSSGTADFVASSHKMFIDGRFVAAAPARPSLFTTPPPARFLRTFPEAESEDVNRAVAAARRAFDEGPWPRMSASERGRILWRVSELLEKHNDEFAELESLDNGKPFSVARIADVPLAADMFRYMAGWTTKITAGPFPSPSPATSTPTRCASPSASWRRSFRGTSRC